MAAKIYSLKKQKDFNHLFKNGRRVAEKNLILKMVKNDLDVSRFAIVISGRVSRRATVRNKIRRWLREIIKANLINIRPGFDIAFFCSRGIIGENLQEVKKITESLLQKSGLLKK